MAQQVARPARRRALLAAITSITGGAVAAGLFLCIAPAQASNGDLTISSVDVASPARLTGAVKATVHVNAPADSMVTYSIAKPAKGSALISADGQLTYRPRADARHRAARDGALAAVVNEGRSGRTPDRLPLLREREHALGGVLACQDLVCAGD
jgi:hypothetical protein